MAAVAPSRPSATHRPCSPPGGIAASVGLKGGIVKNKMSQELQLSIGASDNPTENLAKKTKLAN